MRTERRERLLARIEKRTTPPVRKPDHVDFIAEEFGKLPSDASREECFLAIMKGFHRETPLQDTSPLGLVEAGIAIGWLDKERNAESLAFIKAALDAGRLSGDDSREAT